MGLTPAKGRWLGQGDTADQDGVSPSASSPTAITLHQENSTSQVPVGRTMSLLKGTEPPPWVHKLPSQPAETGLLPRWAPSLPPEQRPHPGQRGWTPGTENRVQLPRDSPKLQSHFSIKGPRDPFKHFKFSKIQKAFVFIGSNYQS